MVTRARFAANQQRLPVRSAVDAFQGPRCPLLNYLNQRTAGHCCHLGSEHTFAWHGWTGYERFVRCISGNVESVKAQLRILHPVIEQDTHQSCQRCWPIARGPDSAGIGRGEHLERVPEALPGLVDLGEGLYLEQSLNTRVLGVFFAGLEQPAVDLLAL